MASEDGHGAPPGRGLPLLLKHEVVFFGGKGGVGKTTVAAAVALAAADRGVRTLLVSTDPAHSTGDVLATPLGNEPREIVPNLAALEIDPAAEVDRYIDGVKDRIAESIPPRLASEVERQIEIARVSPGAEESALFDRFTRILTDTGERYNMICFDTAPLGHTLRLLSLPELMGSWISGLIVQRRKVNTLGRMWRRVAGTGDQSARDEDPVIEALRERQTRFEVVRTIVTDPRRAAFVFVVTPEHLPVAETERGIKALDTYGIPVGAVIMNQLDPSRSSDRGVRERKYLDRVRASFAGHAVHEIPRVDEELYGIDALRSFVSLMPLSLLEG